MIILYSDASTCNTANHNYVGPSACVDATSHNAFMLPFMVNKDVYMS